MAMKNVKELIAGDNAPGNSKERMFFWTGLLATVVITGYLTYWFKKKLQAEING